MFVALSRQFVSGLFCGISVSRSEFSGETAAVGRRLARREALGALRLVEVAAQGHEEAASGTRARASQPSRTGSFYRRQSILRGLCCGNGGPGWPIGLEAKCSQGAVQGKETLGRSGHSGPFGYANRLIPGYIGQFL